MTERLDQKDAFLRRFRARVLQVTPSGRGSGGAIYQVRLDRTAFYPEGGGQPSDRGSLQGLPVAEVRQDEGGPVHTVEGAVDRIAPPGSEVQCELDWGRRFDHMQQHSGQHLLSRAFLEVASARTRSFHLGDALCTLDIEMSPPDAGLIGGAQELANRIIWEDRPVRVVESLPLSGGRGAQDPALAGLKVRPGEPIRSIQVEGFDETPCGGTHVSSTGQVGAVVVTAWEAYKKMTRLTFVCGGRVVRRLRETNAVVASCVAGLSSPEEEVPAALERLLQEKEASDRRIRELERRLAREEAAREAREAPTLAGWTVLRRTFTGAGEVLAEAQRLVKAFVEEPGRLAVVTVTEGDRATLISARSAGDGPPLGALVSRLAREAGGRGGGSSLQARAGGIPAGQAASLAERLLEGIAREPGSRAG